VALFSVPDDFTLCAKNIYNTKNISGGRICIFTKFIYLQNNGYRLLPSKYNKYKLWSVQKLTSNIPKFFSSFFLTGSIVMIEVLNIFLVAGWGLKYLDTDRKRALVVKKILPSFLFAPNARSLYGDLVFWFIFINQPSPLRNPKSACNFTILNQRSCIYDKLEIFSVSDLLAMSPYHGPPLKAVACISLGAALVLLTLYANKVIFNSLTLVKTKSKAPNDVKMSI